MQLRWAVWFFRRIKMIAGSQEDRAQPVEAGVDGGQIGETHRSRSSCRTAARMRGWTLVHSTPSPPVSNTPRNRACLSTTTKIVLWTNRSSGILTFPGFDFDRRELEAARGQARRSPFSFRSETSSDSGRRRSAPRKLSKPAACRSPGRWSASRASPRLAGRQGVLQGFHLPRHARTRTGAARENDIGHPHASAQIRQRHRLAVLVGEGEIGDLAEHGQRAARHAARLQFGRQIRHDRTARSAGRYRSRASGKFVATVIHSARDRGTGYVQAEAGASGNPECAHGGRNGALIPRLIRSWSPHQASSTRATCRKLPGFRPPASRRTCWNGRCRKAARS